MNNNHEIPAFPTGDHPESQLYANPGMNLRDYFAARAMQAMLARDCPVCTSGMAKDAYIYADAMLAARSA